MDENQAIKDIKRLLSNNWEGFTYLDENGNLLQVGRGISGIWWHVYPLSQENSERETQLIHKQHSVNLLSKKYGS